MAVRIVTATEASRSFDALLGEVERGETVVVTRGGTQIASIGPASVGNGAEVLALLAHDIDEDFAADLAAARAAVTAEDPHGPPIWLPLAGRARGGWSRSEEVPQCRPEA